MIPMGGWQGELFTVVFLSICGSSWGVSVAVGCQREKDVFCLCGQPRRRLPTGAVIDLDSARGMNASPEVSFFRRLSQMCIDSSSSSSSSASSSIGGGKGSLLDAYYIAGGWLLR